MLMLSFLRRQLSVGNIVAVVALVFAMAGGAFAASGGGHAAHGIAKGKTHKKGYVITAASQIKPSVRAQLKGARGATGAAGPAGKDGTNGANGSSGQSVSVSALSAGDPNCPLGGAKFAGAGGLAYACDGTEGKSGKPGANGESVTVTKLTKPEVNPSGECNNLGGAKIANEAETHTAFACNGEKGESGQGELKEGETERGTWQLAADVLDAKEGIYLGLASITYPRPLEGAPAKVQVVQAGASTTSHCKGSVSNPEAEKGYLCLYANEEEGVTAYTIPTEAKFGAQANGYSLKAGAWAFGSWAVTGG